MGHLFFAGLVVIWAVSGGGYFWPIWVMVGWGLGWGISAVFLGLLPQLSTLFPVFSHDCEQEKVEKQLKNSSAAKVTSNEKTPQKLSKKTTVSLGITFECIHAIQKNRFLDCFVYLL